MLVILTASDGCGVGVGGYARTDRWVVGGWLEVGVALELPVGGGVLAAGRARRGVGVAGTRRERREGETMG